MDLQPITLSPEEYQIVVNDLASRDPVIRALMAIQQTAQRDAQARADTAAHAQPAVPESPPA